MPLPPFTSSASGGLGLSDDLEYVASHRSENAIVGEAVSWALAARHANGGLAASSDSLPIVELADRVRVIPLFAALSVDELFRIAEAGEEIRHPAAGNSVAATPAADVLFLLEGGAQTTVLRPMAKSCRQR